MLFVFIVFFSFKFSRYMCTYLRNHLNFQNAFVFGQISTRFLFFCTHFGGLKKISLKTYEINVWVWKKGTPKDSSCCSVVSKVALTMLFTCNNNKEECDVNTRKHMILFHKRSSLTEKVLCKSINKRK